MIPTTGWAAFGPDTPLSTHTFSRRDLRPDEVAIDIDYCGVCASDLAALQNSSPGNPIVPGHEILGRVREIGAAVRDFAPGDKVAVGTIIDSCNTCPACTAGRENWCFAFPTLTYGGQDPVDAGVTQGGYSTSVIAVDRLVYHVPDALYTPAAAPLFCAGVTVFAPLTKWEAGPGKTVGVIGMGGLGHLALKFAHAMGARTVLFTTSPDKADAARALGADEVVISRDADEMERWKWQVDLIIDTVGAAHPFEPYFDTLALDGTHVFVGIAEENFDIEPMRLLYGAKRLAGASGEGSAMVRQMVEFCVQHAITAEIELLPHDQVNVALERLTRNDVRHRFVLDLREIVTPPAPAAR